MKRRLALLGGAVAALAILLAQQPPAPSSQTNPTLNLNVDEWDPRSTLVVPQTVVKRAKYPFIDVHNHQRDTSPERLTKLLADMDALNMRILINSPVSGGSGATFERNLANQTAFNKQRFAAMTNIDMNNMDAPDYPQRAAAQLEKEIKAGAVGLKVWRNFGMNNKDSNGKLIALDDPRYDPVWEMCAKYKIPVLIHTADPKPLFEPADQYNERWIELKQRKGRNYQQAGSPPWETLIQQQHNVFRKHRNTIFIAAHLGWLGHDLAWLGRLMDELPNLHTEIGAVLADLGRQPRFARQFFIKYQDRVLFGKDAYNVEEYYTYFRMLETSDEYIQHFRKYPGWKLYALDLPDEVLKKLYYKNALRIFPGLDKSGFPN